MQASGHSAWIPADDIVPAGLDWASRSYMSTGLSFLHHQEEGVPAGGQSADPGNRRRFHHRLHFCCSPEATCLSPAPLPSLSHAQGALWVSKAAWFCKPESASRARQTREHQQWALHGLQGRDVTGSVRGQNLIFPWEKGGRRRAGGHRQEGNRSTRASSLHSDLQPPVSRSHVPRALPAPPGRKSGQAGKQACLSPV